MLLMVSDALVGPAVAVATPVVSRPAMLALAMLTGEVPGNVASPSGLMLTTPLADAA
jgi:hypothetical protein